MNLPERQSELLCSLRREEHETNPDAQWVEILDGEHRSAEAVASRGLVELDDIEWWARLTTAGRALADKLMEEYQR